MAEGPEEARGRPPGQDEGGGDHEPVPSLRGPPAAAAPRPQDAPQAEPQVPGLPPQRAAAAAEELEPQNEPGSRAEVAPDCGAGLQGSAGCEAPESGSPPEKPARLSAREYSRQVHEWLWQSYCGYLTWHSCLATFPAYCSPQPPLPSYPSSGGAAPQAAAPLPLHLGYYNPFYFLSAGTAGPDPGAAPGIGTPAPVAGQGPRAPHVQGPVRTTPATRVGSAAPSRTPSDTGRQAGREYVIPSLAHRFMAEMVDFLILFFIKATIVLSIMHLSGIKDISKFAMHYIIEEIDEDTSMEDLQKMMVVALIYRLLVCFYEIICIWGAGGATPGKFLLGLRVVTCDTSVLIAPSRVLVIPSSNVSITTSTIRALIKNFSIASFFPAFITLLFFQHNRTAYDIVAGTIVVKRNGVR
ncbi:family with sequence similarity 8 member A1 [Phyllostomus discolor]|uniref:Family with sequence similarity 8 member A1 n=1 Tax=Phyllostomus discolor TaxID=89673 RepID=A0A6J2LR63_9CHIR|nr:protein FAM8A1 [Phyllostomus discolor]KAF6108724.1 family with sequence similarity 8 member A1 [Phyllostomus discolor]